MHDLICAFEVVRTIKNTATPYGLRIFCNFLCNVSCVLLAPFWSKFCRTEVMSKRLLAEAEGC